jgi:hypothetical protein
MSYNPFLFRYQIRNGLMNEYDTPTYFNFTSYCYDMQKDSNKHRHINFWYDYWKCQ